MSGSEGAVAALTRCGIHAAFPTVDKTAAMAPTPPTLSTVRRLNGASGICASSGTSAGEAARKDDALTGQRPEFGNAELTAVSSLVRNTRNASPWIMGGCYCAAGERAGIARRESRPFAATHETNLGHHLRPSGETGQQGN